MRERDSWLRITGGYVSPRFEAFPLCSESQKDAGLGTIKISTHVQSLHVLTGSWESVTKQCEQGLMLVTRWTRLPPDSCMLLEELRRRNYALSSLSVFCFSGKMSLIIVSLQTAIPLPFANKHVLSRTSDTAPLSSYLSPLTPTTKTSLVLIRQEDTILPHTKNTIELRSTFFSLSSRTTLTKILPLLPRLAILIVSPQMKSLRDPPQISQSLLSAEDLDVAPARLEDGDIAGSEVFDHDCWTPAGLGLGVLEPRSVRDADREIWIITGPGWTS